MTKQGRNINFVRLLNEVCVGLGCCGGSRDGVRTHVTDYLPPSGLVTADEFAVWALEAEGLNPQHEQDLRRAIRNAFISHMGTSNVDASELVV